MKSTLVALIVLVTVLVACTDDRKRDRLSASECDEYVKIMLDNNPGIDSMANDLGQRCRAGDVDRQELVCFRKAGNVTDLLTCADEREDRRHPEPRRRP